VKEKTKKKIDRFSKQWQDEANTIARSFCPPILPCGDCGHPVIQGYCCTFCGSSQ